MHRIIIVGVAGLIEGRIREVLRYDLIFYLENSDQPKASPWSRNHFYLWVPSNARLEKMSQFWVPIRNMKSSITNWYKYLKGKGKNIFKLHPLHWWPHPPALGLRGTCWWQLLPLAVCLWLHYVICALILPDPPVSVVLDWWPWKLCRNLQPSERRGGVIGSWSVCKKIN